MLVQRTKKILALLLALSLLVGSLTIVGSANSSSDYTFNKSVLTTFGVSYADAPGADYAMTRAQFITMLGSFLAIKPTNTQNPFSDVGSGSAVGDMICHFYNSGYLSGTSETTFSPDENATLQQALMVIIRMLGYGDMLEHMSYITIAKKLELTSGVTGKASKLTYAMASQLLMNLFEVPMADVEAISKVGDNYEMTFTRSENAPTLPEHHRDIKLAKAVVTATPYAYVSGTGVVEENYIAAGGKKYLIKDTEPCEMLGYNTYIFYSDEGSEYPTVEAIFKDPSKNDDFIEVSGSDILSYSNFELRYNKNGKSLKKTISDTAIIIYNGRNLSTGEYSESLFEVEGGSVTLCDADRNGVIEAAIIKDYTDIFASYVYYDDEELIIKDKDDLDRGFTMDLKNKDKKVRVVKANGSVGTLADVKKGQLISCARSFDGTILEIRISDKKLYGEIKGVSKVDEVISIATFDSATTHDVIQTEYNITSRFANEYVDDVPGDGLVWFYFNTFGEVAYFEDLFETGFYAYMMDIELGTGLETKFEMKVFNQNGKVSVYEAAKKFTIDSESVKLEEKNKIIRLLGAGEGFEPQMTYLSLNASGKISAIDTLTPDVGNPEDQLREVLPVFDENGNLCDESLSGVYNLGGSTVGLYYQSNTFGRRLRMDSNAILMGIPVNPSAEDEDYVIFTPNFFNAGTRYEVRAYSREEGAMKGDVYTIDYAAMFEESPDNVWINRMTGAKTNLGKLGFWSTESFRYAVVNNIRGENDANGDEKKAVYLSRVGSVAPTAYLFDTDCAMLRNIRKGMIVRYTMFNNKITYIEPLFDAETKSFMNDPYTYRWNGTNPSLMSYYEAATAPGEILFTNSSTTHTKNSGWEMVYGGIHSYKSGMLCISPMSKIADSGERYKYLCPASGVYVYDDENHVLVNADLEKVREYVNDGDNCTKAFMATQSGTPKALILFDL